MPALRRKSKWRSKNQRRRRQLSPASRAWAAETRRLNRAQAAADAEARLAAEATDPPMVPAGAASKPLRIRITAEVVQPDGKRDRHQFTASWCPMFRSWSVPASRIRDGIAALMARAPEIAAPRS